MVGPKKIQSTFALLDVKHGRVGLLREVGGRGTDVPPTGRRVPVVITGEIVEAWGHDDGESREFEVQVTSVKIRKRRKRRKS